MMQIDLTDQVALVTGSAHRVGKSIAIALAKQGVHIMVHYNSADSDLVRATLHDIKSYGVDAFDIQADIATPEGLEQTMEAVRERFGKLHILVNSASVFPADKLLDASLESWDLTMNVNLRAPFFLTQQAAWMMQQNDPAGGVIINILDQGADNPWPGRPLHGISKYALWMLTQVSALTLGPDIRVNAIVPGPVMKTSDGMSDEQWMRMGEHLPMKTTGSGEDVGRAAVYLAQESFVTGARLHVNGGEHLTYPHHGSN